MTSMINEYLLSSIIDDMFNSMRSNAHRRNHSYPIITIESLKVWLLQQKNLQDMLRKWEESGYDKWLKPSIDRLDNNETYYLDNIQLLTWKENFEKEVANKRKPVCQYTLDDEFIDYFASLVFAEDFTGICKSTIGRACKGKAKHAGGFIWRFADD